jgi:glycosyltransferase involved in cell wall biosynthesis
MKLNESAATHAVATDWVGARAHHEPRIRVAAVLDTWIVSGPGRQLAALAVALKPLGVEIRVIMFQREGRQPSPYIDYLRGMDVEHSVIRESGPLDGRAVRDLSKALNAFDPHIVQSHGYRPTGLVSLLRLRRRRWRWIGFFHGATRQDIKDRLYNRLNFAMLRRAERLVVLSEEHRGWFAGMGKRVHLIHNACLTLPQPSQPLDISRLRRPANLLIGVVARLSHEKGADILVRAAAGLRKAGLDADLVIAGDGPERERLLSQAEELGLAGHVHFLGRVEDVVGLYRQIDVLVIPSRDGAEGLPNVLLEALSCDLPVVATKVAAVPEVLADANAGELVEPGNVDGMQSAIQRALATGRSEAARKARMEATRRFSLDERAGRHLRLYRELVALPLEAR